MYDPGGWGDLMSDQPGSGMDGLSIELARRIDAICRRFEADWRAGRKPAIADYLGEVPDEGRCVLRSELEALDGELQRLSDRHTQRS